MKKDIQFQKDKAMYLRCRHCLTKGEHDDIEVALDAHGVWVRCKSCDKLIALLTPDTLQGLIDNQPQMKCECCEEGDND